MVVSDFNEQFQQLRNDKHIRDQAGRLMPVLQLIQGTKGCPTLDEVVDRIVTAIIALEDPKHTTVERTANVGGITVERGPMDGYSVHLWATDIYLMHLERFWARK